MAQDLGGAEPVTGDVQDVIDAAAAISEELKERLAYQRENQQLVEAVLCRRRRGVGRGRLRAGADGVAVGPLTAPNIQDSGRGRWADVPSLINLRI